MFCKPDLAGTSIFYSGMTKNGVNNVSILREVRPTESVIPSLDQLLLKLSVEEVAFLRHAISEDDETVKARIFRVQKAYALFLKPSPTRSSDQFIRVGHSEIHSNACLDREVLTVCTASSSRTPASRRSISSH